jgi:hypothetical protein
VRAARGAALLLLLALAVSSPGHAADPRPVADRAIGVAFDDLAHGDLTALARRVRAAELTSVTLAIGRPDWLAYPSERGWRAEGVETDRVSQAMHVLGDDIRIGLTLDAFAPRMIAAAPGLAGMDENGDRSPLQASAAALAGEFGDRLIDIAAEAAERYEPDRLVITELTLDAAYGDDDLARFARHSGRDDWPRRDGRIDTAHPAIAGWKVDELTDFVGRLAERLRPARTALIIDVDLDAARPAVGATGRGQHIPRLLRVADGVTLWAYDPDVDIPAVQDAIRTAGLPADRITLSLGLWRDDGAADAAALGRLLWSASGAGVGSVHVTPSSLLGPSQWAVLERWSTTQADAARRQEGTPGP